VVWRGERGGGVVDRWTRRCGGDSAGASLVLRVEGESQHTEDMEVRGKETRRTSFAAASASGSSAMVSPTAAAALTGAAPSACGESIVSESREPDETPQVLPPA
jgi:hypothetical protein